MRLMRFLWKFSLNWWLNPSQIKFMMINYKTHFYRISSGFLDYRCISCEEQEKINDNLNLCCIIFWQDMLSWCFCILSCFSLFCCLFPQTPTPSFIASQLRASIVCYGNTNLLFNIFCYSNGIQMILIFQIDILGLYLHYVSRQNKHQTK